MKTNFTDIPQTRDLKRCMIHPEIMHHAFQAGKILPFPILFAESENQFLIENERLSKTIIQFSFIVTNGRNDVMLYERVKNDHAKRIYQGHGITHGKPSLLVSFSPVTGNGCPSSDTDILNIYHQEVPREKRPTDPPQLTFLGLIHRAIVKDNTQSIDYYFYVFEVHYDSISLPFSKFLKDSSDKITGCAPINSDLYLSISKYKADVQALKLLISRKKIPVFTENWDTGEASCIPASVHSTPLLMQSPGWFISHSCEDHHYTRQLTERLKAHKIPYWIDDDHLIQGKPWYESARLAERYGKGVIFIVTPHFLQSPNTAEETELARETLAERGSENYIIHKLIYEPCDKERSKQQFGEELSNYSVYPLMDSCKREEDLERFITHNLL